MKTKIHTSDVIKDQQLQRQIQKKEEAAFKEASGKKLEYNVRRYQSEDKEKVLQLIKVVWDKMAKELTEIRFDWQYVNNPNNPPEGPIIFIVEEKGKIVGLICGVALKIKIENMVIETHWCVDYMVHPKKRGKYGVVLADYIKKEMNCTFGFPVDYTLRFWYRQGARKICEGVIYSKIDHFQKAMKYKKGPKWRYQIDYVNGRLRKMIHSLVIPKVPKETMIQQVFEFDDRFDQLWKKASKDYPLIGLRDKKFLNWRFFECSQFNYNVYVAGTDKEIFGYIVIRNEEHPQIHYGYIVDIFTRKGDQGTIVALLKTAMSIFEGVNVQETKVLLTTTDKSLLRILRQFGFVSKEIDETGVFLPGKLNINVPEQTEPYVTYADSDLDLA